MRLAPYQEAAVNQMLAAKRFLLADEPGVGKTFPAIVAASLSPPPRLFVVPAHLQRQWESVLEKECWSARILAGGPKKKRETIESAPDWLITSYSILGSRIRNTKEPRYQELLDGRYKTLIFDEAHALRSHKSNTSQAALRAAENAQNVYLLTGTPEVTNAGDWFMYCRLMGLLQHRSYWRFCSRHCQEEWSPFGKKIGALKDPTSFHEKFLGGHYLRRALTSDEVGLDLSEPRIIRVTLTLTAKQQKIHAKAKKGYRRHDDSPMLDAGTVCHYLRQFTTAPPVGPAHKLQYVQTVLDRHPHEKVVCLTWYQASRDAARAAKRPTFTVRASDPKEIQLAQIDAWRATSNGLLVGTLPHMKEGVDGLQAAQVMILLEQSYLASENEQAIGRLQRRGQKGPVLVYIPVVEKTFDAAVDRAARERKARALRDLLEDEDGN